MTGEVMFTALCSSIRTDVIVYVAYIWSGACYEFFTTQLVLRLQFIWDWDQTSGQCAVVNT